MCMYCIYCLNGIFSFESFPCRRMLCMEKKRGVNDIQKINHMTWFYFPLYIFCFQHFDSEPIVWNSIMIYLKWRMTMRQFVYVKYIRRITLAGFFCTQSWVLLVSLYQREKTTSHWEIESKVLSKHGITLISGYAIWDNFSLQLGYTMP